MVDFPNLIDEASETSYFGNTLLDYIYSLILFIMSFILLYVVKSSINHRLSRMKMVKENTFLNVIISTLKKYITINLVTIFSIYLATRNLSVPLYIKTFTEFLVLIFIGYLFIKLAVNILDAIIDDQREKDSVNIHIVEFFNLVARSFITVIVVIWVLSNIGINVTSFLAGLGILSLAIAFALREIIADIFASFVILIDKPFEIGDSIKVGDDSGVVESIGIRSSHIRAAEGYMIVASNRELTNKRINNMKLMERRRVSITMQISQETPRNQLHVVPETTKSIISSIPDLEFDKANLINIGEYSYDYEIIYYVLTRDFTIHLEAKQKILYGLIEALEREKITMPYPTQTIIIED